MKRRCFYVLAGMMFFAASAFAGNFNYPVKVAHEGGDLTPSQAYEMVQKDPEHTFIVDVRTRAEYQMIGHPVGAYNIPYKYWNGKLEKKKYGMTANANFEKDLLAQFDPAKDKLIFMCRSGKRSCLSATLAVKAGWNAQNVFNLLGGFEGDKIKDKGSIYYGQRKLGGWRNEGLPWTYHIDTALVYKADLVQ